jgi:hypothetical protein
MSRRLPRRRTRAAAGGLLAAAAVCALISGSLPAQTSRVGDATAPSTVSLNDDAADDRILELDCRRVSPADVRDVLSRSPAPRIILLQGSLGLGNMPSLAEFLIAMGYPGERLRNPAEGSLSYSGYTDSRKLAGILAWYYEHEGIMPMLIGHSLGGMVVIRVLHELAGGFEPSIEVWNPLTDRGEGRTWIVDPAEGTHHDVVGLQVPYAAALATGKLPRLLQGQWTMLGKLRQIPDSVDDFTGYTIPWDLIAGTFPGSEPYKATGSAIVRNVELPAATGHIGLPDVRALAEPAATRAWIERYSPGDAVPVLPETGGANTGANSDNDMRRNDTGVDPRTGNLLVAADVWYSVKKHWCLEAQRLIRTRRMMAARDVPR